MVILVRFFRKALYVFIALAALLFALLQLTPLSWITIALPSGVQLLGERGNVHTGSWKSIDIKGTRYPLACDYQRQTLGFSRVSYWVNCDAPLTMTATITASTDGEMILTDGLVLGDIAEASPWLALLDVPVKLSGDMNMRIEQVHVQSGKLTYLDLNGVAQQVYLFDTLLLNKLDINTLNKQLSGDQPIVLEMRAQDESEKLIQLYLISEIHGKNYRTIGEVSGARSSDYAALLTLLGQQIGNNRFAIHIQGTLY